MKYIVSLPQEADFIASQWPTVVATTTIKRLMIICLHLYNVLIVFLLDILWKSHFNFEQLPSECRLSMVRVKILSSREQ